MVDRLRVLIVAWEPSAPDRAQHDLQIRRHRQRAQFVLRACQMLYAALGTFVLTSLTLAIDAFLGFRIGVLPTVLAVVGVSFLLLASIAMGSEVSLAVRSFADELDQELERQRG